VCARGSYMRTIACRRTHTQRKNTSKHTIPSIKSHYAFHNLFRQVTNACVVACRSVVQGVAGCCDNNALQQHNAKQATHCNTLQHTATHCNTLQHNAKQAIHCNTLSLCSSQFAPTRCISTNTATHCNTLQHTATHRNTLALCISQIVPTSVHQ